MPWMHILNSVEHEPLRRLDVFMSHHLLHRRQGRLFGQRVLAGGQSQRERGNAGTSHTSPFKGGRNPEAHFVRRNWSFFLVIDRGKLGRVGWESPIRESPQQVGLQLFLHTAHEQDRFILSLAFTV